MATLLIIKPDTKLASVADIVPVVCVGLLYGKDRKLAAQDITSQANALYETMLNMIQRLRTEALDMFGLKVAVE